MDLYLDDKNTFLRSYFIKGLLIEKLNDKIKLLLNTVCREC